MICMKLGSPHDLYEATPVFATGTKWLPFRVQGGGGLGVGCVGIVPAQEKEGFLQPHLAQHYHKAAEESRNPGQGNK